MVESVAVGNTPAAQLNALGEEKCTGNTNCEVAMNDLFEPDFHQTLEAFEVPGASIAIVKDDAVVFTAGYGVCELGYNQPVDEHTLFAAGSISKSITATCLAMLVGEGKLLWDDPVTKYLPDFQLYDSYVTR
ncbi:MAG: beta-lactamase family protein, partial [Anaerolineales bacterium]|nr:beta-lactamase family protein [Anaerolineales bacterium]